MANITDENRVYKMLMDLVVKEVEFIVQKKVLDGDDLKVLPVLARMYSTLKEDLREDLKAGVLRA